MLTNLCAHLQIYLHLDRSVCTFTDLSTCLQISVQLQNEWLLVDFTHLRIPVHIYKCAIMHTQIEIQLHNSPLTFVKSFATIVQILRQNNIAE